MKLFFRLFFIIAAAAQAGGPIASESVPGKFHLVYLVSAVDLAPGAQAFVDPLLLTDGEKIIGFYEYCKSGDPPLTLSHASDQDNTGFHCSGESFRLSPTAYHIRNNDGIVVTLGEIAFGRHGTTYRDQPINMGDATVVSVVKGVRTVPEFLRDDSAPQYFFLMARDESVLNALVPVPIVARQQRESLLTAAKSAAETKTVFQRAYKYRIQQRLEHIDSIRLVNPLFADLDRDRQVDLAIGIKAVYTQQNGTQPHWLAIGYIKGGTNEILGVDAEVMPRGPHIGGSGGAYKRFISNGYAVMTPLLVIDVGVCRYVMRYFGDVAMAVPAGIQMDAIGGAGRSCRSIRLMKFESPA